ncbi:MAG: hypothetical protein FP820_05925 [Sulfurimonas sp.]|nr:hypothetical protein [Sulfurimonas sp.]MBU1216869.1 hypothetical protein [bacterium]MBU1434996.1 hypothetical protein [bacterium]MBU1504101.1 hypothetical protein [bacterium]MBU3938548.1 hypothetical protein [bacterium]
MKISAGQNNASHVQDFSGVKNLYTEKLSLDEAKELKEQIVQNANAFTFQAASVQSNLLKLDDKFTKAYDEFQSFLNDVGYGGKPIAELSKDEAAALVSEDGMFGIKQTSQRIADFVINGAGGDESKLRAGREGMLLGFKQAEEMWGGKLPEISQITMQKATEIVDMAMNDLGFSIFNKEA